MDSSDSFSTFASQRKLHMNNTPIKSRQEDYQTPSLRLIDTNLETNLLASNLEPIDGGDDPDIDW